MIALFRWNDEISLSHDNEISPNKPPSDEYSAFFLQEEDGTPRA